MKHGLYIIKVILLDLYSNEVFIGIMVVTNDPYIIGQISGQT
jgi:hypothetical protein